MEGSDLYADL